MRRRYWLACRQLQLLQSMAARGVHGSASSAQQAQHAVAVALGSNMGDRVANIKAALAQLPGRGIEVLSVSRLYESAPAYVTDQPAFLNAALVAATTLGPGQMLHQLKQVEAALGRDFDAQRWGPRPVDLDIIFYEDKHLDEQPSPPAQTTTEPGGGSGGAGAAEGEEGYAAARPLQVPHPRWRERPFVTAPLADLAAGCPGPGSMRWGMQQRQSTENEGQRQGAAAPIGQGLNRMLQQAAEAWRESLAAAAEAAGLTAAAGSAGGPSEAGGGLSGGVVSAGVGVVSGGAGLEDVIPLADGSLWRWSSRSWAMGILNVTPDSFSDGGSYAALDTAVHHALCMAAEGADIIDVGGQSTRPGADEVSAEEEADRVLPVIRALAQQPGLSGKLISIDTFYADVARQAVEAGAHIVNDVSGGRADPRMFDTVAKLDVPYIMMHMRGNPKTMQSAENKSYDKDGGVCAGVARELGEAATCAMKAGVLPWSIILDPGLGFSKTGRGNLQLMSGLADLRRKLPCGLTGAPLLVGASRKGFLGRLTGRAKAADRDYASAAATALLVGAGANIVRAHNVPALCDAMRVADAVRHMPEF